MRNLYIAQMFLLLRNFISHPHAILLLYNIVRPGRSLVCKITTACFPSILFSLLSCSSSSTYHHDLKYPRELLLLLACSITSPTAMPVRSRSVRNHRYCSVPTAHLLSSSRPSSGSWPPWPAWHRRCASRAAAQSRHRRCAHRSRTLR